MADSKERTIFIALPNLVKKLKARGVYYDPEKPVEITYYDDIADVTDADVEIMKRLTDGT